MILKNGRRRSFSYQAKASMSFIPIRLTSLCFKILKRKEIITWIHDLLNWQTSFDSKKWWEKKLSCKTKAPMSFVPIRRMSFCFKTWKERRLLRESMINSIYKQILILKIGGKRSFSYKVEKSMSFIPIRRMSLCFKIMKRKEIITWIHDQLNWQMNFDSKKWWEEKLFLQN